MKFGVEKMGRPRKPPSLHVVQGTHRADRHGKLPSPLALLEPLGPAPKGWTPKGKALWHEMAALIPQGVAGKHDRLAFEVLVRLMIEIRSDHTRLTPAMAGQIRAYCGVFAMTPSDRAKLVAAPKEVDDHSHYFAAPQKEPGE
jgi:hypothetical protein